MRAAEIHALVRAAENVKEGRSDVMGADYMDDIIALANQHDELVAALEAFLRAPSIGSNGPGSSTIVVQDFNLRAARAALAKAGG